MVYVHDQIKQKQKNIKVVGEVIKSFDSWRTIYAHEIKKKLRVPRGQPLQISFTSYAGPRPHSSSQGFSLAAPHLIEAPIEALIEAWIENKEKPPVAKEECSPNSIYSSFMCNCAQFFFSVLIFFLC